jgi:transcriptional regulator with XRE-family HTH domain
MSDKNKLEQLFGEIQQSQWYESARRRKESKHWLKYSQEIALAILEELDHRNITQKALAEQMNVSPQVVNKWLKGKENFTLETISKLEAVLQIRLLKIGVSLERIYFPLELLPPFTETYTWPKKTKGNSSSFKNAKVISMPQAAYSNIVDN